MKLWPFRPSARSNSRGFCRVRIVKTASGSELEFHELCDRKVAWRESMKDGAVVIKETGHWVEDASA